MWKKCGTLRQATDDDIIRRMRIACWISKAEYVIIIALHGNSGNANAPQYYFIPTTLPVLLLRFSCVQMIPQPVYQIKR
jgi:hypothetical protein